MRLTQFSISLSVLSTQWSTLSNIDGQHGCSNTQLYLCLRISATHSEITSLLQRVDKCTQFKKNPIKIQTASFHLRQRILKNIELMYRRHNSLMASAQIHLLHSQILLVFSACLVGQDVCLTHSNFVWHTLNSSTGTLCEGRNTLMN